MRRCSAFILIALSLIAATAGLARADGLIVIDNAPPRPDHFAFAPLEVAYHHVDVEVDDRVATTRVDQEFYNPNGARLEGTYLFPLPEGATIDKFSMDIDGKMTEAELLDATKARSTYEEIVRKYKDPALLEYVGRGAMKVRVFPIEPNSRKRIQIRYTQVLKADSSVMEYTYPLNTEKFSSRLIKDVSVKVKLACNTPIKSIYCPTHDVEIRRDGDRSATIGFEAKDSRPDVDFKLIVTRQPDPIGINLLTYRSGSTGDGYFMLLASPGSDLSSADVQPKDICFVLDTSGSMAGPKLEQAKKALLFCLANLNPGDRFEIVRFSTEAENLFGSLVEARKEHLDRARDFVNQLKPIGGTAIDDAMQKAIALRSSDTRPFQIVMLTDGQPTVGDTNEDHIVSRVGKTASQIRVFPFGIGTDINTNLLDRIANDTHAVSQYVLPSEDIEVKVSSFYTKIQSPVLSNVKFSCDNPDVHLSQIYPNVMPDLFKGETLLAFGRYSMSGNSDQRGRITLTGTMNGARREVVSDVSFEANDTHHAFIPRLWATRRVGWLLDEIRMHGESKELVDEVTQLAREHGIVTPYTAYLIMEDERRRGVASDTRSFREMEKDATAVNTASGLYDAARGGTARQEKAGQRAVDNAQAINSLKLGDNLQRAAQTQSLAKESLGSASTAGPVAGYRFQQQQNYAQQVRVVNGRAFYQNGNTWTDSNAQSQQNLKRQEIKFNSDDYFALLSKNPQAAPWLSLGNEVDLVLDDTLYVIR